MQKELEQLIKRNINDTETQIHHYTSLDGLIEIIKSNSLRFTECCYMNDRNEYNDIVPIIYSLKESYEEHTTEHCLLNHILGDLYEDFGKHSVTFYYNNGKIRFATNKYFILCTTTANDSLPMWHYYTKGKSINGCAISLNTKKLKEAFSKKAMGEFFYGNVLYDDRKKVEILKNAISIIAEGIDKELESNKKILDSDDRDIADQSTMDDALSIALDFIERVRLFFKSKSFEYEKEYRVILVLRDELEEMNEQCNISNQDFSIKFASHEGIIRTHIDVTFDKLQTITGVTFSPTSDLKIVSRGIVDMLRYYGYISKVKDIEVKKSVHTIRF